MLLPRVPPEDWRFPEKDVLDVRVEYEFLPKALMAQFIVSRHIEIDKERTLVWREGVVLRWSENTLAPRFPARNRGAEMPFKSC